MVDETEVEEIAVDEPGPHCFICLNKEGWVGPGNEAI